MVRRERARGDGRRFVLDGRRVFLAEEVTGGLCEYCFGGEVSALFTGRRALAQRALVAVEDPNAHLVIAAAGSVARGRLTHIAAENQRYVICGRKFLKTAAVVTGTLRARQ